MRHDKISKELRDSYAANRRAIAVARQEAILAFRAEKVAAVKALAAQMVAKAKADGRPVDFDAYASASRKIEIEYTDREIKLFGGAA